MTFPEFLTVVELFRSMFPWVSYVGYSVSYMENESHRDVSGVTDPSRILRRLSQEQIPARKFEVFLADGKPGSGKIRRSITIDYRAIATKAWDQVGLSFFAPEISKQTRYLLEEQIRSKFKITYDELPSIHLGSPCSLLALVVDMRGFTTFCDDPRIESPYVAALLSGFYEIMVRSLDRYPPTLTKYLGDGLLALWVVTEEDRVIAVRHGLSGLLSLFSHYEHFRKLPALVHGSPAQIAAGVAFGLGSQVPNLTDYTGRPINFASRLCSECPGGHILVERSCPDLPSKDGWVETTVALKSFGEQKAYRIEVV